MSFADQLRRMLRKERHGPFGAADAVERLGIHRRTLHRWLQDEGTAWKVLKNEVKFTHAEKLLADTKLTVGEIAARLGFSEPAAFTRAFKRWSGVPPAQWREEQASRRRRSKRGRGHPG